MLRAKSNGQLYGRHAYSVTAFAGMNFTISADMSVDADFSLSKIPHFPFCFHYLINRGFSIVMLTDGTTKPGIVTVEKASRKSPSAIEIQDWIAVYIADLLEIDADTIDTTVSFDRYGLDSATAVGMTGDLEDWLGRKLDPMLLYDYPTVESFSHHIAEDLKDSDFGKVSA